MQYLKKIDRFLDQHALLLLALLAVVALRIPNFYEPYWYGDEGIYLTIGQAMNKGVALYSEIVDHKTPIIYFLAQAGTQLNFRILNFVWMTAATILFYLFTLRLTKRRLAAGLATLLFAIFTTLPWFEGNIPNGELFVIGFVMLGAVLTSYTNYFKKIINEKTKLELTRKEVILLLGAGFSFGLGILTKVPALFDLAAFATIGFFILTNKFVFIPRKIKDLRPLAQQVLLRWLLIIVGVILPILISIVYFVSQGAGADYLQYGLLYNFHYAGNWGLPFENPILVFLFTLPGKFLVATGLILFVAYFKKLFSTRMQFVFAWFVLAMFASLLSNRPYPHYFLQAIPPLSILVGVLIKDIVDLIRKKRSASKTMGGTVLLTLIATGIFGSVMLLLNVGLYPVKEYYQNWYQLWSGQISKMEYNQRFNHLMEDNYKAAAIIRDSGEDKLFIWGTNPMLYALSGATPTGEFTVAFHIKDLEVYDKTVADLQEDAPKYIVVMNAEGKNFPQFYTYLRNHYRPFGTFDNFTLWRRMTDNANNE